jgi:hypothetical protein
VLLPAPHPFSIIKYSISHVCCPVHVVWPSCVGLVSSIFLRSFPCAPLGLLALPFLGHNKETSVVIEHCASTKPANSLRSSSELALLEQFTVARRDWSNYHGPAGGIPRTRISSPSYGQTLRSRWSTVHTAGRPLPARSIWSDIYQAVRNRSMSCNTIHFTLLTTCW